MSAIFGLCHMDGSPVPTEHVVAMREALTVWGPDGQETIVAGNVALGQQLMLNTPEARYERLPCQTEGGLLFTAAGRLDNREELCAHFAIAHSERPQTPDGALMLRAYETWGENCPDRLLGDWALAVFDPAQQRLFLARDHHGNTSLYTFEDGRRFAFASSRSALLAIGAPRRLNELYLAQMLVSWPAYHGRHTIDRDIKRVPPSHALTVTPERTRSWQYWRLEDTPELQLSSFEDYVEGLLEVYDEAVRCRLRAIRPIGVTLSGGLDSGSVTALAARALDREGQRLAAYVSVPLIDVSEMVGPSRFGDELAYAQATANYGGNVDVYPINAAHKTPVAAAREGVRLMEEPAFAAGNYYWLLALMEEAQRHGVGVLLTGQGGNATISWVGRPELRSLRRMLAQQGWRSALKLALPIPVLRAVQQARSVRAGWAHTAIHPDFARRLNLAWQRASAIGSDPSLLESGKTARAWRRAIIQPASSFAGAIWAEKGAAFQLEVRDPTIDRRVMAYTYAVPDAFFDDEQGQDRRLIRAAMTGLLPDEVRLNRKRGLQAADLGFRLQKSANEVEQILAQLQSAPASGYLNVTRMRQVWDDVLQGPELQSTHLAVTILLRGISAGIFLNSVY